MIQYLSLGHLQGLNLERPFGPARPRLLSGSRFHVRFRVRFRGGHVPHSSCVFLPTSAPPTSLLKFLSVTSTDPPSGSRLCYRLTDELRGRGLAPDPRSVCRISARLSSTSHRSAGPAVTDACHPLFQQNFCPVNQASGGSDSIMVPVLSVLWAALSPESGFCFLFLKFAGALVLCAERRRPR